MALLLALDKDQKRVVLCRDGYYRTRVLASKLGAYGITPVHVDQGDLTAVEEVLAAASSVLWAETPTSSLLRVTALASSRTRRARR